MGADDALVAGRAAIERHAWREAFDRLGEADEAGVLHGADLESLSTAAAMSAEAQTSSEVKERAYRAYVAEGNLLRAAYLAIDIAQEHFWSGRRSMASAWMRKAEQHLKDLPESYAHGHLVVLRSELAAMSRQSRRGARARRAGRRDRRPGLGRGPPRVRADESRVPQDLERGDRDRVRVDGGGLDRRRQRRAVADRERDHLLPDDLGLPRPHGLPTGHRVDRGHRVVLQAPVGGRVPRRLPHPPGRGQGGPRRVGHGGAGARPGDRRARRLQRGSEPGGGLLRHRRHPAAPRRLRRAEDALREAHARGKSPQPALALVRLAQGKTAAALTGINAAVAETDWDRWTRSRLLPAQVEIAVAAEMSRWRGRRSTSSAA